MEFNQETNEQQEENMQDSNEEPTQGKTKQWLQDNLRIIISVLIVVLIAGGIYSYSKRTETPESQIAQTGEEQKIEEEQQSADTAAPEDTSDTDKADQSGQTAAPQDNTSSVATSQETDAAFIQTAVKGDSETKMARKALVNYLEKNADSGLTAEHKIYIEDYLRKHNAYNGKVVVGTSVEFQKNLIQEAVTKAKTLNSAQLQNLHKYVVRVPSLS